MLENNLGKEENKLLDKLNKNNDSYIKSLKQLISTEFKDFNYPGYCTAEENRKRALRTLKTISRSWTEKEMLEVNELIAEHEKKK